MITTKNLQEYSSNSIPVFHSQTITINQKQVSTKFDQRRSTRKVNEITSDLFLRHFAPVSDRLKEKFDL